MNQILPPMAIMRVLRAEFSSKHKHSIFLNVFERKWDDDFCYIKIILLGTESKSKLNELIKNVKESAETIFDLTPYK